MQVLNAPGHVTTSPRLVRADARRQKKIPHLRAIFKTEMADEKRAAALSEDGDGWTVTRKAGQTGRKRGMGECAILTRDDLGETVHEDWIQLTDGDGEGRLSFPNYATVNINQAPSGRVTLFSGAHLEAHIEGKWARIPMPERVRVRVLFRKAKVDPGVRSWIDSVHRWRAGVMELAAKYGVDDIVIAPDGNVDAHKPWVREMIGRAWPGLNLCVTEADDLGKRAVGWVLTSMDQVGDGQTYRQESSDHKAGRLVLKHLNPDRHQPKPRTPPPPFELCTYNGARMDHKTKTAVQLGEKRLGYSLTIYQGYNPSNFATSAGTHGRGVVDFAPFDWERKVKVFRTMGWFIWHRTAIPGVWVEHIHGGIRNEGRLTAPARAQQRDFDGSPPRDGLAGHRVDNTWHPRPPVGFDYAATWHELNDAA